MRGGRRAECRNAHVLHCLLKIILSADLLSFLELGSTNNANSEIRGKTAPKPWKKIRAMSWPACSQTLSMGRNFSPLFLLFSRSFCHFGPKVSKSAKTNGKAKTKSFTPCPVSSFSDLSMGRNFLFFFVFFCFLEVFATLSVQQCQLLIFFLFFGFLFLGFLGEIFTLTNIHWHSFHPSTFYIDIFIELLFLATEPSEKMYNKNSSITHLFRHSVGLMFYWYAEVLVAHL